MPLRGVGALRDGSIASDLCASYGLQSVRSLRSVVHHVMPFSFHSLVRPVAPAAVSRPPAGYCLPALGWSWRAASVLAEATFQRWGLSARFLPAGQSTVDSTCIPSHTFISQVHFKRTFPRMSLARAVLPRWSMSLPATHPSIARRHATQPPSTHLIAYRHASPHESPPTTYLQHFSILLQGSRPGSRPGPPMRVSCDADPNAFCVGDMSVGASRVHCPPFQTFGGNAAQYLGWCLWWWCVEKLSIISGSDLFGSSRTSG